MLRSLAAVLAALSVAAASPAAAGREDQWIFRGQHGDGTSKPSAVFLGWDYSRVLFRATCEPRRRELVVDYYGDGEVPLSAGETVTLRKSSSVRLRTRVVAGRLEGRTKITGELQRMLSEPTDLEIDAPNATGEPWYVGVAEPLARLANSCGQ